MVKRNVLTVPVIGVAFSNWTLVQLQERARDAIEQDAGHVDDPDALRRLLALLRYVDGDYNDPGTLAALKPRSAKRGGRRAPDRREAGATPR